MIVLAAGKRIPSWSRVGLSACLLVLAPGSLGGQLPPEALQAMRARSIGPAGMSGRVSAVDVNLSDNTVIFVGASTGGVWRSTDGGIEWEPVFDEQPVLGIGSVAVFQANPDVVWVGTGEGNPRNSAGVGAGIFKSLDGGDTWRLMGLEHSERIHRVIPHPEDPDVVFAGVLGPAWSDGEERGVYRSTDGGENWERVLFVSERTGTADLVMDPRNPNKLFAALWEYRRRPWSFESGGEGSGLYVTYDGGDHWRRMTPEDGFPGGPLGRIGLAIAPSDPDIVYALVEAERNALLRSTDGGRSWAVVNEEEGVNPRPFYYADIRVDPSNENRIYRLASSIDVSEDGGRSFNTVVSSAIIHGDVHELWIHPDDSRFMIMGNDGGVAFTRNRGRTWRFVENLPLAQFYHINVDME
ncbi:MAG: WD40/YVTN/BNR-like repeat-containing protein, partial [Longimicrobiales bacterium]